MGRVWQGMWKRIGGTIWDGKGVSVEIGYVGGRLCRRRFRWEGGSAGTSVFNSSCPHFWTFLFCVLGNRKSKKVSAGIHLGVAPPSDFNLLQHMHRPDARCSGLPGARGTRLGSGNVDITGSL